MTPDACLTNARGGTDGSSKGSKREASGRFATAQGKRGGSAPAVELHDDLAAAVVIDELELADVSCGYAYQRCDAQVAHVRNVRQARPLRNIPPSDDRGRGADLGRGDAYPRRLRRNLRACMATHRAAA